MSWIVAVNGFSFFSNSTLNGVRLCLYTSVR